MSYVKQTHASGMVGLVLLAVAVSWIGKVVLAGGFENLLDPNAASEAALVEELAAYPGNEMLFAQLETSFPDEYEDFTETLGRAARGPGGDDRVLVAGGEWIARFFTRHSNDFAASPIEHLDRVISLEQGFFEDLRAHDEYACAAMARREPLDQPLPEQFDTAGDAILAARFAAIRGGRSNQQLRFKTTPEDFAALEATMRGNGLGDEQIDVVFGTADPASIGAPLACEMQIELIRAIRAQPEESRALLIGDYVVGKT